MGTIDKAGACVALVGVNFAVVVATSRVSTYTTPDGVTHENTRERRTFVVVKRSGRWLVLLDQATLI